MSSRDETKYYRKLISKQAHIWGRVPEPERSEMLSLFGERVFRSPHLPPPYLARKVKSEVYRRKQFTSALSLASIDGARDTSLPLEDVADLNATIATFDLEVRRCLYLLFFARFTLKAAAEQLGIPIHEVRKLKAEGLRLLRAAGYEL